MRRLLVAHALGVILALPLACIVLQTGCNGRRGARFSAIEGIPVQPEADALHLQPGDPRRVPELPDPRDPRFDEEVRRQIDRCELLLDIFYNVLRRVVVDLRNDLLGLKVLHGVDAERGISAGDLRGLRARLLEIAEGGCDGELAGDSRRAIDDLDELALNRHLADAWERHLDRLRKIRLPRSQGG